jgi:sulfide:quinone oxidoreductase
MLRRELTESEWQITIIDRDERHHYQAGYFFIPSASTRADVLKPKKNSSRKVLICAGQRGPDRSGATASENPRGQYDYDWLVIATGCDVDPSEIEGCRTGGEKTYSIFIRWKALALRQRLKYFTPAKSFSTLPSSLTNAPSPRWSSCSWRTGFSP